MRKANSALFMKLMASELVAPEACTPAARSKGVTACVNLLLQSIFEIFLKGPPTVGTLYHVAIPTDVSLLSLSRRQSRAAGLQRMTIGTNLNR